MTNKYYQDYIKDFSPDKYVSYQKKMEEETGGKYKLSTTPIFLDKDQYIAITNITNACISYLQSDYLKQVIKKQEWFLPYHDLKENDFFGCVDFHITENSIKIIEINLFPPGFSSFIEFMEHKFKEQLLTQPCGETSMGFKEKLINTISENKKYKSIIICDLELDLTNNLVLSEFLYLKKILEENDLKAEIITQDHLIIESLESCVTYKNDIYDRIFNRLIPHTWKKNFAEYKNYNKLYINKPALFFTNPNTWQYSNKLLFDLIEKSFTTGEKAENHALLIDSIPKTRALDSFDSPEEIWTEFESPQKIILKPKDNFASRGVYLKPSNKTITNIFNTNSSEYIIQELIPAGKIPYVHLDQTTSEIKFDLRVVFIKGQISGFYARVYEGGITNFRGEKGGLAPVYVI